ncbi:PEPxxWA-CTERM sorting domain-containing protein [Polymorphobacter sp. PAMC 29334]|uniref:PEPxxWA-CTERM sorting domain-containing protein n=1 Tax=Polymorphobacter sp. PAMC 29334 TaxID=2862331 RepID=UPI001C7525BC|nr:PEPxxWA-CTERM sorting domain-containing protein [Polymorphobacter sp. PAMC 29334]QYE34807.1 PEPxxWA-CTERM sorting domain-containing protein [Polymorphobacter sp. PAMC 29334]
MRTSISLAASLVALAVAAPSAATIYTLTYTGTIQNVQLSGAANSSSGFANGDAFVAKYTVDTGNGSRSTSPGYDSLHGGPENGHALAATVVFTVNGIKQIAFGSAVDSAVALYSGELDLNVAAVDDYASSAATTYYGIYATTTSLAATNLDQIPRGALSSQSSGHYINYTYNYDTNRTVSRATGDFIFDSVAVAVPEPASWLMMIAGFGLVGVTARRRRLVLTA